MTVAPDPTAADVLGDPVRRRILELLRDGPVEAGRIAAAFPVSRPAVSRHLRVLREAGLVSDEVVGRERRYRLRRGPLVDLQTWIGDLVAADRVWSARLDALTTEVARARRDRRRDTRRTTRPREESA